MTTIMMVKKMRIAIISKSVDGGGCQSGLHLWWRRWRSRSRSRRIERRRVGGFWEERFCNDRMNYCIALMIIMIINMIIRLLIMMVFMIRIRWGSPLNQIGYIFNAMPGGLVEWARSIQISRTNLALYWQQNQQRKGISYDDKLLIHSTYDQLQYMCFELNDEDLQKMVIVSVFFSIDHPGGAALHATPPYPPCPPTVIWSRWPWSRRWWGWGWWWWGVWGLW